MDSAFKLGPQDGSDSKHHIDDPEFDNMMDALKQTLGDMPDSKLMALAGVMLDRPTIYRGTFVVPEGYNFLNDTGDPCIMPHHRNEKAVITSSTFESGSFAREADEAVRRIEEGK